MWTWVLGAFVLPMGLVVVVLHPWWRGAPAMLVSTLGWLMVIKGAALMAFPDMYLSMGHRLVDMMPWWQTVSAAMALVGLYLTVEGWFSLRGKLSRTSTSQRPDLSRTA
ncbi:membrane protein [Mycobacteroides abscessus subsp. abscessus]|nr:membrane protein [Mycobacteroides abscessus subsp. abscessus]